MEPLNSAFERDFARLNALMRCLKSSSLIVTNQLLVHEVRNKFSTTSKTRMAKIAETMNLWLYNVFFFAEKCLDAMFHSVHSATDSICFRRSKIAVLIMKTFRSKILMETNGPSVHETPWNNWKYFVSKNKVFDETSDFIINWFF